MKATWAALLCLLLLTVRVGVDPGASPDGPAPPAAAKEPSFTGEVVSDADGSPLPKARVELFEQVRPDEARRLIAAGRFVESLGRALASTQADASGRFKVAIPPGDHGRLFLVASAPGHARSVLLRSLRRSPDRPEKDVGRLALPGGRRLAGKVVDAEGKPVAGATVLAMVPRNRSRRAGPGAGFVRLVSGAAATPPFPVWTTTGSDGAYTLESVCRPAVGIQVYAKGMAPARVEESRPGSSAGQLIKVTAGFEASGKVVAPDGTTPVAGAWVLAGDEGLDGAALSGKDGGFRFAALRAGSVPLQATASSVQPDSKARATTPAALVHAPSASLALSVPPAKGAAPPVLRMRPGGQIQARAVDLETREPVPDSTFVLAPAGDLPPIPAEAGATGELTFTGVPAGGVRLRVEAEGYLDEDLGPLTLAAGQTRRWGAALKRACAVEGVVRDAAGRPVAEARVSVSGTPEFARRAGIPVFLPIGVPPVQTDTHGRFLLEPLPPAEALRLGVEAEGFAPWEMPDLKLKPGEKQAGLEVLLDAGLMITGRILSPDGTPVASAAVTASKRREGSMGGMVIRVGGAAPGGAGRGGGRGGGNPASGDALPAVLSEAEGTFRVRGASPGVWSLEVQSRGFAPKTVGGLKLEDGARALDAGDVRLEPGASIRGRVATAAGEPVAYARTTLRREFTQVAEVVTGADGVFEAADLIPGEALTVSVDAEGFAALEKGGLVPPIEDLSLTLSAASRITGTVIDRESRRPVPDFSITVSRSRSGGGGGMIMNMAMAGPETTFHAEDGAFELTDVDPGKVTMAARAPGFLEATMRDLEVPEGKDLTGMIFELERSGSVSGVVSDERGRPIPGVSVSRKEASGGPGMIRMASGGGGAAVTDADGAFSLEGLEKGPMTIAFSHRDYEPSDLDVDTARDVSSLRVTLSRGATLTGIVLQESDGSPVARATITASAAGADRFGGSRSASTGADGSFTLEGVSAGRYTLRAEASGLRPAVLNDVVVASGSSPPPLELKMGGGVTLSGSITGVKEEELPRFTVRAFGSGSGGFGTTAAVDASGRFEIKGLAAGSWTLSASSGLLGGRAATRSVQIPEGVPAFETTIEFPRGHRVEGTVTRGSQPLDGASVIFMNEATRSNVTATTDLSGRYAAEDLDEGDYSVSVMHFGSGASHQEKVSLKADRQLDIEIPARKVTGRVHDASGGQPLDGAVITFRKEGAPASGSGGLLFRQEARTDSTGYFALEGLEDGTYTLTARKDGYGFASRALLLAGGEPGEEIDFELSRVDSFTFRAVDAASGLALRSLGAMVLAGGGSDPLSTAGTGATPVFQGRLSADAAGLFRLDSLQPGTYRVVLDGQGLATETIQAVRVPGPEMALSLGPGGLIEIRAESLAPGQTARAVLLDDQGHPIHTSTFNPEPAFTLRPGAPTTLIDVKPGSYRVRASLPGGGVAEKPAAVAAGQTAQVSIP